jgi:DNA-binding NarL/FixJ family response regulator
VSGREEAGAKRAEVSELSELPEPRRATTVMLVDDHPVLRYGVRMVLEDQGLQVVAEAGEGGEALKLLETTRPDVVLIDLQMPNGMGGVEAIRRIQGLADPPPVLVLTTYSTDADILNAVEAGATGYLLKDGGLLGLAQAVQKVAQGETVLADTVAGRLMGSLRAVGTRTALSRRERELLRLLAAGRTNRQLAKEMFISEATVKSHLVHIFEKLQVDSRIAAVRVAQQQGLI